MPPLGTLSEAEIQLLNDPTKSVKRAQLANLCRKASLKVKGTNADLIAALKAAVYNKVDDRENVDPLSMSEKNEDDPFRTKSVTPNEENSEQSFETVIQYNTTSNGFWTQSTPVKPFGRKTLQRKSMKRKSNASGLYPEISVYPDLGNMEIPSTSNQDFGRVANGILEEMNNRIAEQSSAVICSPPQPIFKDIVVPLKESPFLENTTKHRFSDVHNKLFDQMDSVKTHYAAHRDTTLSPDTKPALPSLRISKRTQSTLDAEQPNPKRMRQGTETTSPTRFAEGRREESMSKQGREIQNLMRQELQKRIGKKLGLTETREADDSIEVESRHLPGKTGLSSAAQLRPNHFHSGSGKVIPVKSGLGTPGIGTGDTDDSLDSARNLIKAPALSMQEPTIVLVPGREEELPKDKKVPVKHADVTKSESRALVIPAAKIPVRHTRTASARSVVAVPTATSYIPTSSPIKYANFTMGSIPTNPGTGRRKSLRTASRGAGPRSSPVKPIRTTRSVSANPAKGSTIRVVQYNNNKDIQVPVKFDGGNGTGKRKYKENPESSPTKRVKLNQGTPFTPARKGNTSTFNTPSTALVRYNDTRSVVYTPGTVSSRTPTTRVYGNGRSAPRRPPWR